jgi:hypothetical protein
MLLPRPEFANNGRLLSLRSEGYYEARHRRIEQELDEDNDVYKGIIEQKRKAAALKFQRLQRRGFFGAAA